MKLIFLHGAPATGKLTIAKALLRAVPGRLFDNHAAIDVARMLFEFGAPGFWELVSDIRCSVLEAAAQYRLPLLVTTYCYAKPADLPEFENFESIVLRRGGEVLPVFLSCSTEELVRRVSSAERADRKKISSEQALHQFLAINTIAPVPRANCLRLDSAAMSADATAAEIVRHFRLTAAMSGD